MTFVWIGLRRSGNPLLKNVHMLNVRDQLALQALLFPLRRRLHLVRGTSSEVAHPAAPSSSSSLPSEGWDKRGRGGGSLDAPCAAPRGASSPPARRVSSERSGSASGHSSGVSEHTSVSSAPSRAEDPGAARSQRTPVARSAPSSVASPHSSLHTLRGDESRESSESRSVRDPPLLPDLRLEKHGRTVEPTLGRVALVTGLIALAPLPARGQAVESVVGVTRLDRYLPMSGRGGIDCGLRTAIDPVEFARARFLGMIGLSLRTATDPIGIALDVTGRGLLTATGHGGSVAIPCSPGRSP